MTKLHYLLIVLGSALFFWDSSYGVGWLLGWVFVGLLRQYRERILEAIIDFKNFSVRLYIVYLIGVVVWIALPFALSVFFPEVISPIAIFAAFFADRALMFIVNSTRKGDE